MLKESILDIDDVIPIGKYKGTTVRKVIEWPDNLQRNRIMYLSWLFSETHLRATKSVENAMREVSYKFLLSDEKARNEKYDNGGEYTDMDIWVGLGDPTW